MVAVRRRLQTLLRRCVDQSGGRVFGDMGDGVAAVFDSPIDAAHAALSMRAEAAGTHEPPVREPPIEVRIGLHTGDVVLSGDGFVGMTVHLGARLCDAAPDQQIAASDAFRDAIDADPILRVVPFGKRILKGLVEPVNINLVVSAAEESPEPSVDAESSWSIPSTAWLAERDLPPVFIERQRETVEIERLASESDGRVQLALVSGEPGIGKSTLLHQTASTLAARGHLCVVGRSDESISTPYREMIEVLRHIISHAPPQLLVDHVLRHGSLLTRLIPGLADRVPNATITPVDEEPDRFRLFEAVTDLLRSVAQHQPLVIVLEDIHWASESSLELIRHLIRAGELGSVLVLATFRPTEIDADAPLSRFLRQVLLEPNAHRIRVEPFTLTEVQHLVTSSYAESAVDENHVRRVGRHLHRQTSGNPLFVTEMLRSLEETGSFADLAGTAPSTITVPATVHELATARVDRLGQAHRELLTVASVLGATFDHEALAALVDPAIDVLELLAGAQRAGLVVERSTSADETFRFGHALIRDALYERISPARRRRLHREAAEAIISVSGDDLGPRAAVALRHLRLASHADPELVLHLAELAAEQSSSKLLFEETVTFRRMAVDAVRTADDQAALASALLALADAETAAGKSDGRQTSVAAADAARAAGRWDLFARVAVSYGGQLKENQAIIDIAEPVALITEALDHETERTPMRARLLAALGIWQRQHRPYVERRAVLDEALDIARSLDDPRTLARVLAGFYRALHGPNATDAAWEVSAELEHLALELGDDNVALEALNLRLLAALELGHWTEIERVEEQLEQVAARVGNIEGVRITLLWKAARANLRGESPAVLVEELSRLLAGYSPESRTIMIGALNLVVPWMQGRSGAMYELASSFAPPGVLVLLAADGGLVDAAKRHVAELGGPAHLERDQDYLFFLDLLAMVRVASRTGDHDLARDLYEVCLPYRARHARLGLVAYLGSIEHLLGTLAAVCGEHGLAMSHFQQALGQYREIGARPHLALCSAELTASLEAVGRSAADARSEATAIAEELGLALVLELLERQ